MDWPGGESSNQGLAEDPNDILVFGYACKLFRDDNKAAWIDDEHHLIPWMGDSSVTIDRYDGRGALMDLSTNVPEGVEPMEGVLANPIELEKLLDRERYRDLREDSEFDDTDYQEVEFRKFQCDVKDSVCRRENSYAAVGYCYEEKPGPIVAATGGFPEVSKADDERPFIKPKNLLLPPKMTMPPTMKLHSIIEKTAQFIANHGSQMEIILKTKQSGNPLFNFLDYKDSLNPYFKFLVQAIREKSYTPSENAEPSPGSEDENNTHLDDNSNSEDEDGYLHPSLFRSSTSNTASSIASFPNFKPSSGNSAYSLLVSKIRGSDTPSPNPATDPNNSVGAVASSNGSYGQYPNPQGNNPYYSQSGMQYPPLPQNQHPSANDQLVIEKMASYVVKNGVAFEELARTKGDPRFVFLNSSHEYHWYYLNCKERFKVETSAVVASQPFVNYSSESKNSTKSASVVTKSSEPVVPPTGVKRITLQSIELPLSASGIPIANLESISNRPTSIPPEVASRIELIKKKHSMFAKKETSPPKIQFSSAIGKGMNLVAGEVGDSVSPTGDTLLKTDSSSDQPKTNHDVNLSIGITEYPHAETQQKSSTVVPDVKTDEEKELLRKQMRRQKAAIFLKMKNIDASTNNSEILTTNNNIDTSAHTLTSKNSTETETMEQKNGCKPKLAEARRKKVSPELETRKHISRKRRSRSKSRSHSPSYSRSHSSASSDSSFSDSSRRRKHSKRKSSKKRKKKHSHERTQSSSRTSKKSKKRKR